uniref:Immunoglobulin/major histocompatibility complex n=1 Tax=Medicago truncatula TaxID=3880 RepID=A2Q2B4_MEDTR|nr:Immunoglobulin/major histocompatibility complex [Medicago truncatula]
MFFLHKTFRNVFTCLVSHSKVSLNHYIAFSTVYFKICKKSYRMVFWSFPAVGPIFILVTVSESFQIVFFTLYQ